MKTCITCKKSKNLKDFTKQPKKPDGRSCYCKSCHAEQQRKYRSADLEHSRKIVRDCNRRLKEQMVVAYGGKCICCGEIEIEFLTIDHKDKDRKQHIAKLGANSAGVNVYRDLRKRGWPQNGYRLMCMNCNFAIRLGGVCPHQKKQ